MIEKSIPSFSCTSCTMYKILWVKTFQIDDFLVYVHKKYFTLQTKNHHTFIELNLCVHISI